MLWYGPSMSDNFRRHSDDWSRVPHPAAPSLHPQGYGVAIWAGPQFQYQPVQVPIVLQNKPQLSVGIAYLLWLLLGLIGAHYFYMGKIGVGVLYLLTGGLLGIGWFIDLFTLKGQVERANGR